MTNRYYCGIDAGSTACKLVLMDDGGRVVQQFIGPTGTDPGKTIESCFFESIKKVNVKKQNVKTVVTGRNGKTSDQFSEYQSELVALAVAARFLDPAAKTVIDAGGFSNKVLKLDASGKIHEYAMNDICSSGSGIFMELVCKSLDIPLEDVESLATSSTNVVPVTSQCSIFAESEVIYLMNENKPMADIIAGVCHSIAGRLVPQVAKLNPEPSIMFTGGIAKNGAITNVLENRLGIKIRRVDMDPQLAPALGAAILASGMQN
nr:acyl-CoA dehydratase activase [Candidatus Sigynarchaeota archaeon]